MEMKRLFRAFTPLAIFMGISFAGSIFIKIVDEPFLKWVWTLMNVIFLGLGGVMFVMQGGIKVLKREIKNVT